MYRKGKAVSTTTAYNIVQDVKLYARYAYNSGLIKSKADLTVDSLCNISFMMDFLRFYFSFVCCLLFVIHCYLSFVVSLFHCFIVDY